ncbi:hypothetical protein GGE65_003775 [Skermanella aerolata]|jgi:hypothetical protein
MGWRAGGFSAYDLPHVDVTAKSAASLVMKSADTLDGL